MDCFGGIGGTALDAMWNGLHWIGNELEPRFVGLAQQNIDLWQRKYGSKPGFGSARIVQGDSRKLSEIIASADLVCSSPPFMGVDNVSKSGLVQKWCEQTGRDPDSACRVATVDGYGATPGQLGAMKEGEAPSVDLMVSSPPYARSAVEKNSTGVDRAKQHESYRAAGGGASFEKFCATQEKHSHHYGTEDGQLGAMKEGEAPRMDCVISSPPFATGDSAGPETTNTGGQANAEKMGTSDGNIALESGDTFWQAAREIVAQCHAILRPGGHAIWICKRFVRKGKIVEFSDQWGALCEQEGFDLVCRHRAMLVANHGTQGGMFGDDTVVSTARKSFFRRLAEAKGSPAIDWEDVLCMVKR